MRDDRNPTLPPPHALAALRRPRPYFLARPDLLTPKEIADLRRRAKEDAAYFRKAFAHLRPTAEVAETNHLGDFIGGNSDPETGAVLLS